MVNFQAAAAFVVVDMRMLRESSPPRIGCLVLLLAVCLPCSRAEAQRTSVRQTRSYLRQGYVIVAPFANEGGTEDDDWIGVALQQVLQYKLSYEPAVQVYQYERYDPGSLRDYMMPVPGESIEARAAQLAETFARWPVVLGTFLREYVELPPDDEILVQVYVMRPEAGSPKLVTTLQGSPHELGRLLDGALPPLLREVLPWGATGGADWRGKMPTDSHAALQWFARGRLAAQEDAEQAALCYQSAVDLDPNYLAARWAMAPMARMQRDTQGALEHVNVVAAALPNDVQVRMARANALSGVEDYMEAAREYQLCIKLNPRLERSLNQHIIRCYSRAGEMDKALEWAQGLLAAEATNAVTLTLVGEVYEDRGEHEKAIDHYTRAIRQQPTNWRGYWLLGNCYAQLGRLDDAVKQYRAGILQQPEAVVLTRELAEVYEQQGNVEEAIREWERLLELSAPDTGMAREAEQRLAALERRK